MFYPLTHPQKRIWYIDKFYQDTSIGNIAGIMEIPEAIDYRLMEASINSLIEKNDALRLRIVEDDGKLMQYISEYKYIKLDYFDLSNDNYQDIKEWGKEQAKIPIDIDDSDLYYFAFIKVNNNESHVLIKVHHLVIDAWSVVRLTNTILEGYIDLKNGNEINNKRNSYTAFISSEQEYLESSKFTADKEFWNNKFDTIPEPASLSSKDTGLKSGKSNRRTFVISEDFTSRIKEYCHEHKTSIFSLFLSVLAILINRVTDNNDIVIGTPVLNRSNFKEKETLGMFVSTVPIRIKMDDNIDFNTFEKNVISDWMTTLRHQRYPYDLLLKDLRKKHMNMDNLYNILLSYQNAKFNKTTSINFDGIWHPSGYQADSLFIHINDRDCDGCIDIDYDYMTQFFNEEDLAYIHNSIMNILQDAISNPYKFINQMNIIVDDERQCILDVFNDTTNTYQIDKTMQQLFEEQAALSPENIAIVFENKQLTYRQLNERSNQVAKLLRIYGVKPDSVVGILLDRSLEMIIAIMAVLKAGGCYLPLDPEYPIDRISYMLEDSQATVLLSQGLLISEVNYSGTVIDMNSSDIYKNDSVNLENINTPNNLAYVMYTSGSTGKPKAVMIEHGALVNYINAIEQLLDYRPGGTVLSVTTMAFDIFVFELFPSLANGLRIVLANDQQQRIPELLSELIIREKVEKILTTPSRLHLLAFGQSNHKCFDVLKEIVLGGEAFPQKLLDKLKQVTKARIFNLYGPTEATVYATFKELTCAQDVNIGSPISNYRIYIVDKYYNLMPIGVQGEICISGDSLARGYLNNPELTDEKFIPNPYEPGKKMYRTGDLGKWSSNGEIEFIGRMDHQIKIRGYRIELGEIENQLMSHKKVREAVVIDKEDDGGKKYLSAYYVSNFDIKASEFRAVLNQKLPSYMVPSFFTRLNEIPLTPNGKIDRRALPEPKMLLSTSSSDVKPRNDIDETLVAIWCKILNTKVVGIDDIFFDIGGDSLTIIEVQVEMLKYNWNLNTQDFYEFNTIRKLSDRLGGITDINHYFHTVEDSACIEDSSSIQEVAASNYIVNNSNAVQKHEQGYKYRNILLTGATGFLGIHILKELLSNTDVLVHCIIRGQTSSNARERLLRLFEFYFPNDYNDIDIDRLFVVKGDVTESEFGFDKQTLRDFGEKIDLVIHTAAIVKYFGDYDEFKKTNVTGTDIVSSFCMMFNKPLAHISTLGVSGNYLVGQERQSIMFSENDFYIGQRYMDNVYTRTKFEAEQLLYKKMAEGLKLCIFRIGNLTGRYSDGHFQPNIHENAFYNVLKSLIKLGAINVEVLDQKIEFTPVDLCSKAITTLLNTEVFLPRVYHIHNHNLITLKKLLELFKTCNINIAAMNRTEFANYIDHVAQDDQKSKYLTGIINDIGRNKYLDFSSLINIDSTISNDILKQLGFEWPNIDSLYLSRIINHMKTIGYL